MAVFEDPLGHILVERQFLAPADCQALLETAGAEDRFLEEVLIRDRNYSRKALLKILENEFFCPSIDLTEVAADPALLTAIPRRVAVRHLVFPVSADAKNLSVACFDPSDTGAAAALASITRKSVVRLVALRHELRDAIGRHYDEMDRKLPASIVRPERRDGPGEDRPAPAERPVSAALRPNPGPNPQRPEAKPLLSFTRAEEQSASALVDRLIDEAARRGTTDIHIEPKEHELLVRFRLDGVLCRAAGLPANLSAPIVSRVKVLAEMDIAERRLPQDGRYAVRKGDQLLDLRISCIPSQFGEKLVIRLLSRSRGLLDLENLGMPPAVSKGFSDFLEKPQGFFLVTGPTGSGKTTTLYAALNALDCESVNVMTLEDPIEYTLERITQIRIREDIGLTFAAGLRAFLRQDPDVIFIGEIRDAATVESACRAALTGHKVFSTIHTNDAAQAIPRLIDMGAPPYLVAATLKGILAQRLFRTLCPECREAYAPNPWELALLGYPRVEQLHRGRGCAACSYTGFRGRKAVFEYLPITEKIVRLIAERASSFTIQHIAEQEGMITMGQFGRRAVLDGITSVAEIQRVILTGEDQEQLCTKCGQVVSLEFAVCPFCQQVLKEKCAGCEHPLDPAWEACPNCGLAVESELRKSYCPHCQAPVPGGREHCPFCGGGLT